MKIVVGIKSFGGDRIYKPSELVKAQYLGRAEGTGNAKGTVGPMEPSGGNAGRPEGAPKPQSPKTGQRSGEISKRGGHKDPYDSYKTNVSGMKTDASKNYLKLTNTETGRVRKVAMTPGSANSARFDHKGNLVSVTIDGKRYPCADHLVKLPKGVYRYSGMVDVAGKVGKPGVR